MATLLFPVYEVRNDSNNHIHCLRIQERKKEIKNIKFILTLAKLIEMNKKNVDGVVSAGCNRSK